MPGQTVILAGARQRDLAHELINKAGDGFVINIKPPTRNTDQNALMWVLLSDISRAQPEDRFWTPETWKAAFMHSLGHEYQFLEGLDNSGPLPIGFKTSRLTKSQMADLITTIQEYGDRHGVQWSEQRERKSA